MARKRPKRKIEYPPARIVDRIPIGRKTWLADPDGIEQLWIKNADGTMKKLRHR